MKVSTILLACVALVPSSNFVAADNATTANNATTWAATISRAQNCMTRCANTDMLFQTCLSNNTPLTGEFETCCQMGNYSCSGSITDANATLSISLLGIKSAANEYLSCVS